MNNLTNIMYINNFSCVSGGVEDHLLTIDPIVLPDIIAHTRHGNFRGTYSSSRLGMDFLAFRGIRYAKPPVGNLRFKVA